MEPFSMGAAYGSGRAFAPVFRAIGVDADIVPPSDDRTRLLLADGNFDAAVSRA